ncbi:MAG: hypothetical protein GY750_13570 [Lentisphaerae bacterium]|nr:hypothetical protein [Lentisphaerota bacterium]MCP4102432.1 hypothetical protein [Lentisphaerota bacterium]
MAKVVPAFLLMNPKHVIEKYCLRCDLSSHDSSDLWKTSLGLKTIRLNYKSRLLGLPLLSFLKFFDFMVKPSWLLKNNMQEYPEVRANCAMSLMNIYPIWPDKRNMDMIYRHLYWLTTNECMGSKGSGWGNNYLQPISREIEYSPQNALASVTAVCVEALCKFKELEKSDEFDSALYGCLDFLLNELQTMEKDKDSIAVSCSTEKDLIETNVQAAVMKALACLYPLASSKEKAEITLRVKKLYNYLKKIQMKDGCWKMIPGHDIPVSCRCCCNILTDIAATATQVNLPGSQKVINKGWRYVVKKLFCEHKGIFKRYNDHKLSRFFRYTLSDNAAAMHTAIMLGNVEMASTLNQNIEKYFIKFGHIYSRIDQFGMRKNKDYLRDGVSSYLLALSELIKAENIK